MPPLSYNERSWAIDLISHINVFCANKTRAIVRAGGENTLKGEKGKKSLYPDVILFGDQQGIRVRQGWELKLPDTPISDPEFYNNAQEKANRLHVNSFLLWNVDSAILYVRDENGNHFSEAKQWGPLGIKNRADVKARESEWLLLLKEIIDTLNNFYDDGKLKSSSPEDILSDNFFSDFLEEYWSITGQSIETQANKSAQLEASIKSWWADNSVEHGKKPSDPINYKILSTVVLTNWINRFLFCHYLKNFHGIAKTVEQIDASTSLKDAQNIFNKITAKCDFMQVFLPEIGAEEIGFESWQAIGQLNKFLTDLKLDHIPQEVLHGVIERALNSSRRKVAGQYTTPKILAALLVNLAIEDRVDHILDPCCGTGTIPRAAYDLKISKGMPAANSLATIWASDKFQFPLQLCTLAMADPAAMGEIVRIFKQNVFTIKPSQKIDFTDPNTGNITSIALPLMGSIVSNLPFVRFEDLKTVNPDASTASNEDPVSHAISGKSDLFGYIILYLRSLLKSNGRIGIIVSNSWLGADWGKDLRIEMERHFHIRVVVTSGSGRWFDNAAVVTNILILEKKHKESDSRIKFVTTLKSIKEWDDTIVSSIVTQILNSSNKTKTAEARVNVYSHKERISLESLFVGWSGFFSDISWANDFKPNLIKASSFLKRGRGERRGWDPMFYPSEEHGIEKYYIRPVLKNTKSITGYIGVPDAQAFCCSADIATLEANKHTGALAWIRKFENEYNEKGKPLPDVLARANQKWYEMKPDAMADIVMGMNPEDRIFAARMKERSFVNQRLMSFIRTDNGQSLPLLHALLNSTLNIFMIESAGFGRGQGALDLQPSKLSEGLYILDPSKLNQSEANKIVNAFKPIENRAVLPLESELLQTDRNYFDKIILEAYGMEKYQVSIYSSLLDLYRIRKSVKN